MEVPLFKTNSGTQPVKALRFGMAVALMMLINECEETTVKNQCCNSLFGRFPAFVLKSGTSTSPIFFKKEIAKYQIIMDSTDFGF